MSKVFRITPKRVRRVNGQVITPEMEITVTTRQHCLNPFYNGAVEVKEQYMRMYQFDYKKACMSANDFTYDRYFEGGRVGILIQVVNESGGITIVPEMHRSFMTEGQQLCLRPIVDPVPGRTISLVIRSDYIHEAKLNAVADAVREILPATMLESQIRKGHLRL